VANVNQTDHTPDPAADMNADSGAQDGGAQDSGAQDGGAPRPHTNAEILAMMQAAQAARRAKKSERYDPGFWGAASFWLLWAGVAVAIGSIILVVISARDAGGPGLVLAGGFAFVIALFVIGAAFKMFSPVLLAGAVLRRATGKPATEAAGLAGAEILTALGLAERVLDADQDARLVTRRDGVVTYANRAYFHLAKEAGVTGPVGLPPRIDRLFAQQGAEATKIFRLCRAAKSAEAGTETIYQVIGLEGGGRRRRFEVSVRPIRGADEYVTWRLNELPVEEEEHDVLAAAYADFPTPVFAIEKSGQIAWTNAVMREKLGAARGSLRHIDDVVLGETAGVVSAIWRLDQTRTPAQIRRRSGGPAQGAFTAFRRGGVGEGFACVELAVEDEQVEEEAASLSGDITEAPFGVAVIEGEVGRDARIVQANKAFTDVFGGAKKGALLAKSVSAETLDDLEEEIRRKTKSGNAPTPVEATVGDGPAAKTFSLYARPVRRRRGAYGVRRTLLYSVEVTDRKRMETDHAQDQKLKGIGQLASKVAHDFNNFLQAVLGNCERLMLKHPAGDPAYQELVQIRENAQRAANVTKQLLAFSRKQTLKREVLSITEILRDFSRFLDRTIGEKVTLELVNGRGLPLVKIDRFQLETAIMNLAVNARDAMAPKGGKLTIETRIINADDVARLPHPDLGEQDHLMISISDTGPGIAKDIAGKIFDPFFTTKEIGKGTGLGLSTVYGIIGQMGGAIILDKDEGKGAIFNIYLPAHTPTENDAVREAAKPAAIAAEPSDLTGDGRILIVEDEGAVRNFVVATLNDCGYSIVEAEDGDEALEIIEESNEKFDLVITDVMMPVMDGPSMIAKARSDFGLKSPVIFMSGYAESAVRDQLDIIEGAGYIQKPFTLKGLAAKVKQILSPPEEGLN